MPLDANSDLDMGPKPLHTLPQAPPNFAYTPSSIVDDAKLLVECSRKVQDEVVKNIQPDTATFANVLVPLANSENAFSAKAQTLGFLKAVLPDPELREASIKAQQIFDDFIIESSMREDLYRLVDAVSKRNEDLDSESSRFLVKLHNNFIRNGLNLPEGPKRKRFKEISKQISWYKLKFKQTLDEDNSGIWFSPSELDGLPKDFLSTLEKGAKQNEGMLRLSFQQSEFYTAMRYAKSGATRKRIFIANDNRCSQNVPLFKETMILRDEAARLLGYPNHVTFRLEEKMAKNPETVNAFLADLRSRLTISVQEEVAALKQLKADDLTARGELFDKRFFTWDLTFYNRLMLETQYKVDQKKISEYFPLETTIVEMLGMFEHLFGLNFVELSGDEINKAVSDGKGSCLVWYQGVQMFSVFNTDGQGGDFLGYLFLDLYPRKDKHRSASNFTLCPVCNQYSVVQF